MNSFYNINNCILDDTQIEAIEDDNKYIIVVAGAGSGKTLTILGKIKYLIEKKHFKEEEILCISFTNETVKSLKKKLENLGYNIDVFTFHKLGLKIINNDILITNDNYLSYIIDEYFKSYINGNIKLNRKFRNLFYTHKNSMYCFDKYEFLKLKRMIETFIKLAKSNNYTISDIYRIYRHSFFRERFILKLILDIYLIYTRELEGSGMYDFDDMISKAIDKVKDANLEYRYIIIDEFQDTSKVRFDLINEIIKFTDSSLFVVGDDWQSIYRFSGCNLELFINFHKYTDNPNYHYLKYTYRNSKELIYVSSHFVMRNKKQIKKDIISSNELSKPIKILFGYNVDEVIKLVNGPYLILGRNNSDIIGINDLNKLTIHRSKGLEEANIILVNSDSIPSIIKNERLLRHVTASSDYILYEEERRLFYVALTRAKEYVYILVNKKTSPFIKELIDNYPNYVEIKKK